MHRVYKWPLVIAVFLFGNMAEARTYLVDFGTTDSYRGITTPSPDLNGNHWNGIPIGADPSPYRGTMVDTSGVTNNITLGFSTTFGTDSYNGPAGDTTVGPPTDALDPAKLANTDIDATALGLLGIKQAAFDFVNGTNVRFEIGGLDPLLTYDLVFFGSAKHNTDSTTIYEAYTDSAYTLLASSATLNVHTPGSAGLHNRNQTATLRDIKPSAGGSIYIQFRGTAGGSGYLNAMQIIEGVRPIDGRDVAYIKVLHPSSGRQVVAQTDGSTKVTSPAATELRAHWYLFSRADTSVVFIRNRITGEALRAATDSGSVVTATYDPDDPRQTWKLETLSVPGGQVSRLRIDGTQAALTAGVDGASATVSAYDSANSNQNWILPELERGGLFPWTSYDEDGSPVLTGGAAVVRSSFSEGPLPLAAEAQKRGLIELTAVGAKVRWTTSAAMDVMTLRYSVADGSAGTLTLKITDPSNNVSTQKVAVTSAQAWVYLDAQGVENQTPGTGRIPAKRFNEARIKLSQSFPAGSTLELSRETGDLAASVDLLETEVAENASPANLADFLNVRDYGAVGDGVTNDTPALKTCISAAQLDGKGVYLPAGTYRLTEEVTLPAGMKLQGAGMWKTELIFSQTTGTLYGGQGLGGIKASGSNTMVRDLYLKSAQTARDYGYKGLKGYWGTGSLIENVWVDQAETGAWIADFSNDAALFTDGLIMRNCRLRNCFADGVNYASGTRNSVVENCHVRGCGDDGIAAWASGRNNNKPTTRNQQIRYNTVECVYRAGGIGVFGGEGHKIHHNLVRDQVAGPGLRFNTVFVYLGSTLAGYPFGSQVIQVYENTLERTGSLSNYGEHSGAIELQTQYTNVENIRFTNIDIVTTQYQAIRFSRLDYIPVTPIPVFANLTFTGLTLSGSPLGVLIEANTYGSASLSTSASVNDLSPNFSLTAPPPPAPTLSSFSPVSGGAGTTVTLNGSGLASLTSVKLGTASASFSVSSDSLVTAVVPAGAVTAKISVENASGSALSSTSFTVQQVNQAPTPSLGLPASVTLPLGAGLRLLASATDDGLPSGATLSYLWTVVSAPAGGVAAFDDATLPNTGVNFNLAGSYLLRLNVTDGDLTGSIDLTVSHGLPATGSGQDVGSVGLAGSSSSSGGIWTLQGSGVDIWDNADGFHFRYAALTGDGFIQARLLSQTNTDPWAKTGLMIRDELTPGSTHAFLAGTVANGLAFQNRPTSGGLSLHEPLGSYSYGTWLRIVRTGSTISAYKSVNGTTWTPVGASVAPSMSGTVYIGLAMTSHNNAALGTATFDNLQGSGFGTPALSVLAGDDLTLEVGQAATLTGSASGAISTQWQKISGPGAVSFGSAASLSTTMTASAAGTYRIRLLANDGTLQTFDELVVSVEDSTKTPATVTLTGLAATYDGKAKPVTVTTTPADLNVEITYNGSLTAPTAAGSYPVQATIQEANYRGTANGTLVIGKATASLVLANLSSSYDGQQKTASAATTPANLGVAFTYDGSPTAPIQAGSYAVTASLNDANYQGTASGTLVITKATASIILTDLNQTYDGFAVNAGTTTSPSGLNVTFTYNGSGSPPTQAGTYSVTGTIQDNNYQGTASGSLVVAKATANVTLGNLSAVYNGSPKAATASTDPAGLNVILNYNGSSTAPTSVGTYAVIGTVQDTNYQGTASGNLVIGAAVTAKGTVLVDFGTIQTTSPTGGIYWNNCTSVGTLTNLVTTNNTKSGFTLTLTNGSFGGGDWVPVMTAQMGLFQVSNAARDGLISVPGDGVRSVKIGGLNANLTYRLGVYAGRSINEKRATLYRVRGATTNSGALTTSGSGISSVNYNNRNILTFTNLVPDATGALYLDYQTMVGSYAHLNAISIEEVAPGGSAGPRMDSVLVDFGGVTTPNPTSGRHWNNASAAVPLLTNLINSGGTNSGVRLEFTGGTVTNNDSLAVTPNATLGVFNVSSAAVDGMYTTDANTGTTLKLSGLNRSNTYQLKLFGSRGDPERRLTLYTVTGQGTNQATLVTSGTNMSSGSTNFNHTMVAVLTNLVPDTNGALSVNYRVLGGQFAYLNALELSYPAALTALETWQTTYFPSDPTGTLAQPLSDPDGDGWVNLLEFSQGTLPTSSSGGQISMGIQVATNSASTNGPTFSFRRRSGNGTGTTESGYTVDGITYTLKASPSLSSANWQSGSSVIQQVGTPVNNGDGTETVTVRILGSNQTSFLKMEVSLP